MQRLIPPLTTLIILLGFAKTNAASVEDLIFEDFGSVAWVVGCDPAASGELIVPSVINGSQVITIGGNAR